MAAQGEQSERLSPTFWDLLCLIGGLQFTIETRHLPITQNITQNLAARSMHYEVHPDQIIVCKVLRTQTTMTIRELRYTVHMCINN